MSTDSQLVKRVLRGDTDMFGELVRRHEDLVTGICLRYLRNVHDAEDAAQETFVRAFRKLGQLTDPERFAGWIGAVASSVALNHLTARRARTAANANERPDEIPDRSSAADPRSRIDAGDLTAVVMASVRELPPKYRAPTELFYLGGLSHKQIAVQLAIAPGNVRTRLHRARRMLRSSLAGHDLIPQTVSRCKEPRLWPTANMMRTEDLGMILEYRKTTQPLLRGDGTVTIRAATHNDIPAMRRFDTELAGVLDEENAQQPPGGQVNCPGGPWSDDEWLEYHFAKYAERGYITLIAEEEDGRIVGFADLWAVNEPEPFGRSLDIECIDYFREYYLAGIETILLTEAEKVARAAGLPSLDIGTNTSSGDYVSLRRFGLRLFYEYDNVLCRCRRSATHNRPTMRMIPLSELDLSDVVKVDHWSPSDFHHAWECERTWIAELTWPEHRAVLELLGPCDDNDFAQPVPAHAPERAVLYVSPAALTSPEVMSTIIAESATLAGEAGADEIRLPCASDIELSPDLVDVTERKFAFAWMRKRL